MPKSNNPEPEKKPEMLVRYKAELEDGTQIGILAHGADVNTGMAIAIYANKNGTLKSVPVSNLRAPLNQEDDSSDEEFTIGDLVV